MQLITINRALNDYVHLQRINQKLQEKLSIMDSTLIGLQELNSIEHRSYVLSESKFTKQEQLSKELSERLKQERKSKIKTSICVGAGGTIIGAIIGMLLIK